MSNQNTKTMKDREFVLIVLGMMIAGLILAVVGIKMNM